MSSDWQHVERLLHVALRLEPARRAAFLERACAGDSTLHAEVASLLDAHEKPGMLDRLASDMAPVVERVRESTPPVGRTIGKYELVEVVGGGGMGVVYKALDAQLSRTVALKFLRPRFEADEAAVERFQREARSVASLEHPNICTVHEIGETEDGQLFLVMPLYEGETLQRRIERGPLPVADAIDIAVQIARGLEKAHARGIVHRDIKPSNIFVTADGVVKVLDFGIAKLADGAITSPGGAAGTLLYMSPEQARGDIVDHRSDLWSLGAVLYEMLAGVRAFPGTPSRAAEAIQRGDVIPLGTHRPELLQAHTAFVMSALSPRADDRVQSAQAFQQALLALDASPRPLVQRRARRSVIGGAALIAAVAALWFAARESNGRTPNSLASGTPAGATSTPLAVASAAGAPVIPEADRTRGTADSTVGRAYDEYLKGRFAWYRRTEDALRTSVMHFERSIAISPSYARAHAGLADAYAVLGFYDYLPPAEAFPRARASAMRAIALDSTLAAPRATLGYAALYFDWDLAAGEAEFKRAIALEPNYSTARQWYANLLGAAGRFPEAEREIRRAQEIDPLSLIANAALGWVLFHSRKYADAAEQCRQTIALDSMYAPAHLWRAWSLQEMDSLDASIREHRTALTLSDSAGAYVASLARALALGGQRGEAELLLRRLQREADAKRYVPSYEIAKVHAALGRTDMAFTWMDRAFREHSHSLVFLRVDPQLATMRADPRFATLVARVFPD